MFYAYVSIEWIDCILLSSWKFNAIFLTFLVNTLFFSLLNLCCDSIINLLLFFLEVFVIFLKIIHIKINFFLNIFLIFKFKFLLWHTFFCLWIFFSLYHCCLLNSYLFLPLMQYYFSLFSLLINNLNNFKKHGFNIFCNVWVNAFCFM